MSTNFEYSGVLPDVFEGVSGDLPSELFSNADYGAIAEGVGAVAGAVGGAVGKSAEKKTAEQLGKTDLQKEIDTRCGKDKSKSWSKKKKEAYLNCKQDVIGQYDKTKKQSSEVKTQQQQLAQRFELAKQRRKNILYIGAGVLLILGVVVYFKNKTKQG